MEIGENCNRNLKAHPLNCLWVSPRFRKLLFNFVFALRFQLFPDFPLFQTPISHRFSSYNRRFLCPNHLSPCKLSFFLSQMDVAAYFPANISAVPHDEDEETVTAPTTEEVGVSCLKKNCYLLLSWFSNFQSKTLVTAGKRLMTGRKRRDPPLLATILEVPSTVSDVIIRRAILTKSDRKMYSLLIFHSKIQTEFVFFPVSSYKSTAAHLIPLRTSSALPALLSTYLPHSLHAPLHLYQQTMAKRDFSAPMAETPLFICIFHSNICLLFKNEPFPISHSTSRLFRSVSFHPTHQFFACFAFEKSAEPCRTSSSRASVASMFWEWRLIILVKSFSSDPKHTRFLSLFRKLKTWFCVAACSSTPRAP